LLKPLLRQVVGNDVALVDSAEAMAEQVAAVLADKHLANPGPAQPRYDFYVTAVPLRFQPIGARFLGRTLNNVHVVKW
jgi:glutamate racemase